MPGDSLWGGIGRALTASDRVLVFVSSSSIESRWVSRELDSALALEDTSDGPLVEPVLLDDVKPSAFLASRVHVAVQTAHWARSVQTLLKGIYRRQSVVISGPRLPALHELDLSVSSLDRFKVDSLAGRTIVVYDSGAITDPIAALVDEFELTLERDELMRLRLAAPRVFEFLAAISPSVLQTSYEYSRGSVSASDAAAKLLRCVWRMVVLSFMYNLSTQVPDERLGFAQPSLDE